jgi:hypothetical protein
VSSGLRDSSKSWLHGHLAQRAGNDGWTGPRVRMRYQAGFTYVDIVLADGRSSRYAGCATSAPLTWGFAVYRSLPRPGRPLVATDSASAAPRRPSTAPGLAVPQLDGPTG